MIAPHPQVIYWRQVRVVARPYSLLSRPREVVPAPLLSAGGVSREKLERRPAGKSPRTSTDISGSMFCQFWLLAQFERSETQALGHVVVDSGL